MSCRQQPNGSARWRYTREVRAFRFLASAVCAALLMLGLPALCYLARNTGPAGRVVFFDYLPLLEAPFYVLAMFAGGLSGVLLGRVLVDRGRARVGRAAWLLAPAALVLVPWLLWPTLTAFPEHASLEERDAWAREHVRHYPALKRVLAALPAVQRDVGRVHGMAPAAGHEHRFAREMNGDDMRFVLEVVGERGRGTFTAVCTLDDARVYDWQPSTWRFASREVQVDAVPPVVP